MMLPQVALSDIDRSTRNQTKKFKASYQEKYPDVFSDETLIQMMNEYMKNVKNPELQKAGLQEYAPIDISPK